MVILGTPRMLHAHSGLYYHRKFRPLSKPKLCYNDNLIERSLQMAKRSRFTAEFKVKVVLESLNGETTQAEVWGPPS